MRKNLDLHFLNDYTLGASRFCDQFYGLANLIAKYEKVEDGNLEVACMLKSQLKDAQSWSTGFICVRFLLSMVSAEKNLLACIRNCVLALKVSKIEKNT